MNVITSFITALQFLTNLTLSRDLDVHEKSLAESTRYFPLAGVLVGCFSAGIYVMLSQFFSVPVVCALVIISLVWVTRGLHLDGFIDTVDGLFGGADKSERLEIMKDTQVGSFGAAALICLILLKFTLLVELFSGGGIGGNPVSVILVLILAPAFGRWSMVCAMHFFPYARKQGTGSFAGLVGMKEVMVASLIMAIFTAGFFGLKGFLIMLCVFVFMLLISKYISLKIGGMTGDTYGCLNEVIEVVVIMFYLLLNAVYL